MNPRRSRRRSLGIFGAARFLVGFVMASAVFAQESPDRGIVTQGLAVETFSCGNLAWHQASTYPPRAVTNQRAYRDYRREFGRADFIWSHNLDQDNLVLCRLQVP